MACRPALDRGVAAIFLFVLIAALVPSIASAQESTGSGEERRDPGKPQKTEAQQEEQLSEELFQEFTEEAILEEAVPEKEAPPPPEEVRDPRGRTTRWDRGVRIDRNDGLYRIKLGGRLMYDVAWIHAGRQIKSRFETGFLNDLRRGWVEVAGTYGNRVIYKLQVDVAARSEGDDKRNRYLREAYIGVTAPRTLRGLRFGSFTEPVTMGENTSSLNLTFMERALPMVFAPSYNFGIMFNNETREETAAWRLGVFRYSGRTGGRQRWDLSGRVTAVPWSDDEDHNLLHIGASYSHQFRNDFELRYRRRPETSLGDRFVDTGKFQVDGVDLLGLEVAGKRGSLSFQSEIVMSRVDRSSGSDVQFWGTYVQVGYFLTGEERPYLRRQGVFGRVRLKNRFHWKHRTWGAWQLAARFSHLDLDDGAIRGGTVNNVTLGLNWHVTPWVRIMANFVRSHLKGSGNANLVQLRFQVDY